MNPQLEPIRDAEPDPDIDTIYYAVFPFRYRATDGDLRQAGYYHPEDDIDYGLLHEWAHQLGLIDLYHLVISPEQNLVNGRPYRTVDCLMHGVSPFLSEHSARAMLHWYETAHGYYGQYLYSLPATMRMQFLGIDSQPAGAVRVRSHWGQPACRPEPRRRGGRRRPAGGAVQFRQRG